MTRECILSGVIGEYLHSWAISGKIWKNFAASETRYRTVNGALRGTFAVVDKVNWLIQDYPV